MIWFYGSFVVQSMSISVIKYLFYTLLIASFYFSIFLNFYSIIQFYELFLKCLIWACKAFIEISTSFKLLEVRLKEFSVINEFTVYRGIILLEHFAYLYYRMFYLLIYLYMFLSCSISFSLVNGIRFYFRYLDVSVFDHSSPTIIEPFKCF